MIDITYRILSETFNEHVPLKKVRIHQSHIYGLSNEAKALMKQRNKARKNNSEDYKKLRNLANKRIKAEKKEYISKQLNDNPNKLWDIYNFSIDRMFAMN